MMKKDFQINGIFSYEPTANITDIVSHVHDAAETFFTSSKGSHDWDHTLRVARLAEKIGKVEKADMEVLLCAAYLHDIGRSAQDESMGRICHAEHGAFIAKPMVDALPVSRKRKDNILHAVKTHRFRGENKPETLEAKILFDSDKLDAIGAVGVARAYLFAGEVGARLHNREADIENTAPYTEEDTGYREYLVKLKKIKDRIITAEGKRIAEDRHRFMEKFFNRFLEEYEGKR